MNLPAIFHQALRWFDAMYAYSPFVAGLPWPPATAASEPLAISNSPNLQTSASPAAR